MYLYTLDYKSSHRSYVYSMVKGLLDVATCIMVGSMEAPSDIPAHVLQHV